VNGNSSPIEIKNIDHLPVDGKIELTTTYKPIELNLPADSNVLITAYTTYGQVISDFPVFLKAVPVKPEAGKTEIFIKTSQDITIRKD
jgi:hypothetical protein